MVNVAATTPPASHLDHGLPRANNKFFGTAKRKRTDQQVREDGQLLQNGAGHSTAVKPDLAGGKQTDEGTLERKQSRGRQPSLRHVKNSTEVLRQRSAKRENQSVALDSISAGREGRNFTVANVGNNGKIYLR